MPLIQWRKVAALSQDAESQARHSAAREHAVKGADTSPFEAGSDVAQDAIRIILDGASLHSFPFIPLPLLFEHAILTSALNLDFVYMFIYTTKTLSSVPEFPSILLRGHLLQQCPS